MKNKFFSPILIFLSAFLTVLTYSASGDNIYGVEVSKSHSLYYGPVPYIVFGIVIAGIIYVGYRYWHDHAIDD